MANRVIVFIDYENLRFSTVEKFHRSASTRTDGHIDPVALAELVVSKRHYPSVLEQVRIYRGRPNPLRQPSAALANDAQANAWEHSPRVKVVRRDLRYPANYPLAPAQEKGVDVALAIDFVTLAIQGVYDVGIIVSRDADLLPALETVIDLRLAHVEVVAWRKFSRLNFPGTFLPWCHMLDERDYQSIRDTTDYLKGRG